MVNFTEIKRQEGFRKCQVSWENSFEYLVRGTIEILRKTFPKISGILRMKLRYVLRVLKQPFLKFWVNFQQSLRKTFPEMSKALHWKRYRATERQCILGTSDRSESLKYILEGLRFSGLKWWNSRDVTRRATDSSCTQLSYPLAWNFVKVLVFFWRLSK